MVYWDDFRVALAIASAGSLSGAARRLRVNQSTISRRLAALEEAVGARLFDRGPGGYTPTAACTAVLPGVQEIEARAIAVEQQLLGRDTRLEGRVRLATSDSFAAWFLIPRLHTLRDEHPAIALELITGNGPVNLARQEADLSLRMSKPVQPNLVGKRLGRAGWALYASEAYVKRRGLPDTSRGLEGHDVLAFDDALGGTAGAKWLAEHGAGARVALRSDSLLSHAAAVVAGLALGPLPCVFGDVHTDLVRVVPEPIGHHEIWLVVHPNMKSSARVRAVMDYLSALIAGEAALLAGTRARRPSRKRAPRKRA